MWKRKETIKETLDNGNDNSQVLGVALASFLLLGMKDKRINAR